MRRRLARAFCASLVRYRYIRICCLPKFICKNVFVKIESWVLLQASQNIFAVWPTLILVKYGHTGGRSANKG
jgi:hypothetical protein